MRIRIELAGDVQMDRELLRFAERTDDMTAVLGAIADDFYKVEKRQFNSEGKYSGGWKKLSEVTVLAREAAGYPGRHPILKVTGDLKESLTREGARGAVRAITRDSLFVGTNIEYAKYHQTGTKNMPRRRPVEFSAAQRTRWVKSIQRYLTTGEISTRTN